MSFYISTYKSYQSRKADLLVLSINQLIERSFSSYKEIINTEKQKAYHVVKIGNKNVIFNKDCSEILDILKAVDIKKTNIIEIEVQSIDETLLKEISSFIEENEISIGLLINDISLIENNGSLLTKYGVFITRPHLEFNRVKECKKVCNKPSSVPVEKCMLDVAAVEVPPKKKAPTKIKEKYVLDESFKDKLFKYLNKSKKTNVEVYTDGGITRKVFSKIIAPDDYLPKKSTILCLIIGMELCLDDALDLLNAAGYTLSSSIRTDKIVKGYIAIGNYDINIINDELDKYGETVLGWRPRED